MGCGASQQVSPNPESAPLVDKNKTRSDGGKGAAAQKQRSSGTVDVVLVLGLPDVSGKKELCEGLCKSLQSSGRNCVHLDVQVLLKQEVASDTELGKQITSVIDEGRIVNQKLCGQLVRKALDNVPPGAYLLDGYPTSAAALESIEEVTGHAPKLALFLELPEDVATSRLKALHGEASASVKMSTFELQAEQLCSALDKRGILSKLDATKQPEDKLISHAQGLVDAIMEKSRKVVAPGEGNGAGLMQRVVLVLGGPGAGKATHCQRLAAKYGCTHLCIEKLMRGEVRDETDTGRAIAELTKSGKIVPAHLYLSLVKNAMQKQPSATCLLDGFPRSIDTLDLLEEQLGGTTRALLLEASEGQLEERLIARGAATGRADDQQEAVKRRIRTFKNQTLPAINMLQTRGVVSKVDASKDLDDVFNAACAAYEKMSG